MVCIGLRSLVVLLSIVNVLTLSFIVISKQLNFSNAKNECLIVLTEILSPGNHFNVYK